MEFYTKPGLLKNQGFIKPTVTKEDFKRGDNKLGGELLMPGGHGWLPYLPQLEAQNQFFETMHCGIFNTLNPIEAIAKIKWDLDWDKSERYSGVMGGVTPQGSSPHNVAESIRKFGVIDQTTLPWTSNLNSFYEYSAPRPANRMLDLYGEEGRRWLRSYTFGHEWVVSYGKSKLSTVAYQVGEMFNFVSTPEALKDALQYSPLGVAVLAWPSFDSQGRAIKNRYQTDNHWTVLYDYIENDCWLVYDSYNKCHVKLQWNYPISFAKRYSLDKATFAEEDANHIIDKMATKNVKGDLKAGIYFIYGGEKLLYPDSAEYYKICDKYFGGDRSFITVAQDALDLIPEGNPRLYDNIVNSQLFINIKDSFTN
jgi:hypothetical protein